MLPPQHFNALLELFQKSSNMSGAQLAQLIRELPLDLALSSALQQAVLGDNRPLNAWLFKEGAYPNTPLVWIAPIRARNPRYVWMVGHANSTAHSVHTWFTNVRDATKADFLLRQTSISPPLLFVDPYKVSTATTREAGQEDEFAIFQTGYEKTVDEVSDLDQRMVINVQHSIAKRRQAIMRLRKVLRNNDTIANLLDENIELYAILHNEGHNQGHFVGAWPHEDVIKKNTVLYESVEEFRACVAAVLLAEHLPLSENLKDGFALSVFMTRFFGFGFDAYGLKVQKRETAREVTVGIFFFEFLLANKVISIEKGADTICLNIDLSRLRPAFTLAFRQLFEEESAAERTGAGLRSIAENWYRKGFPGGEYSKSVVEVYNAIIVQPKGGN